MRLSDALALPAAVGLVVGGVGVYLALAQPRERAIDAPRGGLPPAGAEPVDHGPFFAEPFADGPAVTRACLRCHEGAAQDVMQTVHWTWAGQQARLPGAEAAVAVGKRNLINNFCLGVEPNLPRCTSCHVGYGWDRPDFLETAGPDRVDCLICHDRSGQYVKAPAGAGWPAEGVDLLAAARSVGPTTRSSCGGCHFAGGGGDAVKHGDLDATLHFPSARIDVHMGRHDLRCTDCHQTHRHHIKGRILPVEAAPETRLRCTDCHAERPHGHQRLDAHTDAVACQTCHIPYMAIDAATKMSWDWSVAGRDPQQVAREDPAVAADPHLYSKQKGRFTFAQRAAPEYAWYSGESARTLPRQPVEPQGVTSIVRPRGSIADPAAKIWPFKVHRGRQPYDAEHGYLLVPKTYGEGGFWTAFDWDQALRLGAEATGTPFSGRYGFVATEMAWPLNHMVQRKEDALQCSACHGPQGRIPWEALGYPGDPARQGGRKALGLIGSGQ